MPIINQNVLSRQKLGSTTRLGNRVPMQRSAFTLRSASQTRSGADPYSPMQTQPGPRTGMQGTARNVQPGGEGRGSRGGPTGPTSPGAAAMQGRVGQALGRYGKRSLMGGLVGGIPGIAAAAMSPISIARLGYDIAKISRDIEAINAAFAERGITNPDLATNLRDIADVDPSYDPSSPVGRSRTDTALNDPMGLSPKSNTPNPEMSKVGRQAGKPRNLLEAIRAYRNRERDESVDRDVETGITPTSRQWGYQDPKLTSPPARSPNEDTPAPDLEGALEPSEQDDPMGLGPGTGFDNDSGDPGVSGDPGSGDDTDTTGAAEAQSDAQAAENDAQGGGGGGGGGDGSWFCTALGIAKEDMMTKFRRMAEIYYPQTLQFYVSNGPKILERMDSKALKLVLKYINRYVIKSLEKEDFDAAFFFYGYLVYQSVKYYLPEKTQEAYDALTLARAQWLEDIQTQS